MSAQDRERAPTANQRHWCRLHEEAELKGAGRIFYALDCLK